MTHDTSADRLGRSPEGSLPLRPDDLPAFRMGRLLLLMHEFENMATSKPLDIERVGYYDFFSASPFLIFRDPKDAVNLVLAGFDSRDLSYASSAQRFTNRRSRLQHDISVLISLGLVEARVERSKVVYAASPKGLIHAAGFRSLYALSFKNSSRMVIKTLNRLSDQRLRSQAKEWLKAEPFLIDLYDVEVQ